MDGKLERAEQLYASMLADDNHEYTRDALDSSFAVWRREVSIHNNKYTSDQKDRMADLTLIPLFLKLVETEFDKHFNKEGTSQELAAAGSERGSQLPVRGSTTVVAKGPKKNCCIASVESMKKRLEAPCRRLNKNRFFQGVMFAALLGALFLP
ncbi:unnamed protein product, partial [Prorocentrum cordatum]